MYEEILDQYYLSRATGLNLDFIGALAGVQRRNLNTASGLMAFLTLARGSPRFYVEIHPWDGTLIFYSHRHARRFIKLMSSQKFQTQTRAAGTTWIFKTMSHEKLRQKTEGNLVAMIEIQR